MALMPSGQPRSVPDPAGDLYDEMMTRWRAEQDEPEVRAAQAALPIAMGNGGAWPLDDNLNAGLTRDDYRKILADFQSGPPIGHPGTAESFAPVWGSGREALAHLQEKDLRGALFNGGLAISDFGLVSSFLKGAAKGVVKTAGPHVWRMAPWRNDVEKGVMDVSTWLRQERNGMRHVQPGKPAHHWFIPQGGWGKMVPDAIKNQPWNIKEMVDEVVHGRIHGPYKGLPRFNLLERLHHGVPTWPKLLMTSYGGRDVDQVADRFERKRPAAPSTPPRAPPQSVRAGAPPQGR